MATEMAAEQNKALVREFEDRVNARNLDAAMTLFSPDFIDHTPAVGLPSGLEGVRAFFMMQYAGPDAADRAGPATGRRLSARHGCAHAAA